MALAHHEAMIEYGLYEKVNKVLHCGLCYSATAYSGDIGVLTQYGDWGNWMADAVPEEANWMLEFVRSASSTTPAPSAGAR